MDVAAEVGLALQHKSSGPSFADIDGDGDLDLFLGALEGEPVHVFRNEAGHFVDITPESGIFMNAPNTVSAAFGDYDKDGDLDLFTSHWGNPRAVDTQHLWQNQGDGTFTTASEISGIAEEIVVPQARGGIPGWSNVDYTFSPNFVDIDNDGYQDMLVTGDFGTSQVFINDREGGFIRVTDPAVIVDQNGMGAAVGDYDNDGDLDWFVTAIFNIGLSGSVKSIGNRLYRNKGNGEFEDVTLASGVSRGGWGWGSTFSDFDNDGHLDIFHTNGWGQAGPGIRNFMVDPAKLFISDGAGGFTEQASEAGIFSNQQGRGVVCFDADGDGDLDLLITNNDTRGVELYRNDLDRNHHYLQIKLKGMAPNTEATGARIYLTAGGITQMREITVGCNYASQNPTETHFGLGQTTVVNQIRIVWPEGTETEYENIAVDQNLVLNHPGL